MAVGDAHVLPVVLTPVLTQLFFPKPLTTFLTCFCRVERWKYTRKKVPLNRGSNSQPQGHESGTLTTEPPGQRYLNRKHIDECSTILCAYTMYRHLELYWTHLSNCRQQGKWDSTDRNCLCKGRRYCGKKKQIQVAYT